MNNEPLAKAAWEMGFRLAVSYADNHVHFQGSQKERQWLAAKDRLSALLTPPDADTERLKFIRENCLTLECYDSHTPGGDDGQEMWRVIEYHMAEPKQRYIGFGDTPEKAIDQAMAGPHVEPEPEPLEPQPLENVVDAILDRRCPQCGRGDAKHYEWCGGRPPELAAAVSGKVVGAAWIFADARGRVLNWHLCPKFYSAAVIQSWGIEV